MPQLMPPPMEHATDREPRRGQSMRAAGGGSRKGAASGSPDAATLDFCGLGSRVATCRTFSSSPLSADAKGEHTAPRDARRPPRPPQPPIPTPSGDDGGGPAGPVADAHAQPHVPHPHDVAAGVEGTPWTK
eukprot:gene46163-4932_t